MEIISSPPEFGPAFRDVLYTFRTDIPEAMHEIEMLDPEGTTRQGLKRFTGEREFTVNAAPYLRSSAPIAPLPFRDSGLVVPEHRTLKSVVRANGLQNSTVHTTGIAGPLYNAPLSGLSGTRVIGPDEQDEVSFIPDAGEISARVVFGPGTDTPEEISLGALTLPDRNLVAAVVNMNHLAGLLHQRNRSVTEFDAFVLRVQNSGETVMEIPYRIRKGHGDGVRVCWWNRLGGIDAYTFDATRNVTLTRLRETEDGERYSRNCLKKTVTAVTAPLKKRQAEELAGLVAAAGVWILDGTDYAAAEVRTDRCPVYDERLRTLEFVFAYLSPVSFQNRRP